MNAYLPGYSFGNRMAVVARSEEAYMVLMDRGVDVMHISEDHIMFQPGEHKYMCECLKRDRLDRLCDYDIVEISDTGILYRTYANNEADTTIFLGAGCNSNCIMCPANDIERRKGFSYSRDQLLKYIAYLPNDLEYIVMTGGEPTLNVGLFLEALEHVRVRYPYAQVLLLTNGRSLSDQWLFEQVVEHRPKRLRIAIPVHAASAELHDRITRSPGSFEETMLALTRLMDSDIDIEIRVVVTKVNSESLQKIAELITARFSRIFCVNFIGLEPRGNCALNYSEVYIDHRTSFLKSKKAIDYLIMHGYDVGLYNYPLCSVDRDYWPIAAKSISAYKNVYHPDCEKCSVRTICGGFFTATMSIVKPSVTPVIGGEVYE